MLVPQQTYVFSGTLRENLTYLAPGVSDTEIARAVSALGLDDPVTRIGGYNAALVRPDALPMGERQLITAARVYLSPPR